MAKIFIYLFFNILHWNTYFNVIFHFILFIKHIYHKCVYYMCMDGWMASLTRRTWVWVNSGSWWWTGRPGMLRFIGSQRVGHDWVTELNRTDAIFRAKRIFLTLILFFTFPPKFLLPIFIRFYFRTTIWTCLTMWTPPECPIGT